MRADKVKEKGIGLLSTLFHSLQLYSKVITKWQSTAGQASPAFRETPRDQTVIIPERHNSSRVFLSQSGIAADKNIASP